MKPLVGTKKFKKETPYPHKRSEGLTKRGQGRINNLLKKPK
jgi:hypothetical protein